MAINQIIYRMQNRVLKLISLGTLSLCFFFSSCHSSYEVTKVTGRMIPVDSTLDAAPDPITSPMLSVYKMKVDSIMNRVIGVADVPLEWDGGASLFSNLVSVLLRSAAVSVFV